MQLFPYKNHFITQLTELYGREEAEQFFYMLSEHFLGFTKVEVALEAQKELTPAEIGEFDQALKRLKQQEPIQYIIGKTYFYGNDFKVTTATLIPRPETEELVKWIIADNQDRNINILDIGTGSGCIAISLSQNLSRARVSAVDISAEALLIAKENATNLNVSVNFQQQDILNATSFSDNFDVVVSNPPYVRDLEKEMMSANVLDYEPGTALFVTNEDPLLFYRKIAQLFLAEAKKEATLYFEINEYLGSELKELLSNLGFQFVEIRKDFRGKDRMLKATL